MRHLAAIEATIAILQVQMTAAKHAMQIEAPEIPRATEGLQRLERCGGVPDAHCARVNEDARISKASFGNPHAGECKGCGAKVDMTLAM